MSFEAKEIRRIFEEGLVGINNHPDHGEFPPLYRELGLVEAIESLPEEKALSEKTILKGVYSYPIPTMTIERLRETHPGVTQVGNEFIEINGNSVVVFDKKGRRIRVSYYSQRYEDLPPYLRIHKERERYIYEYGKHGRVVYEAHLRARRPGFARSLLYTTHPDETMELRAIIAERVSNVNIMEPGRAIELPRALSFAGVPLLPNPLST